MKVNSQTEVAKLNAQFAGHADTADSATNAGNADTVDGKHAAEFAPDANQNGKADNAEQADNASNLGELSPSAYQRRVSGTCPRGASIQTVNADGTVVCHGVALFADNAGNADKLDNKDSTAFGIKTDHAKALAHDCDTPDQWNECAPVTVTIPSGRKYIVSVWYSFSARSPGTVLQTVNYCSAGKGPSIDTSNPCITPFAVVNGVFIDNNGLTAASSSGDTIPLEPGTYTFFTAVKPPAEFSSSDNRDHVITKVMVRDVTNTL